MKSFLTIIALFIVVLIVSIILTKIILKEPTADPLAEENETETISPELTLQSVKPTKDQTQSEEKSSNLRPEEIAQPTLTEKPKLSSVATKPKIVEPQVPKFHEQTDIAQESEVVAQKSKTTQTTPKRLIEKAKEHPTSRPVNIPQKSQHAMSEKYYIQVGSFKKTPSRQFLEIIKKSGYHYTITPVTANGTKKLLIGPYRDRATVNRALVRVRDRINKSAFVYKEK